MKYFKNFRFIVELLPYFLLGAGIFIAGHFNKNKVVFLNIIFAYIFFILQNKNIGYFQLFIINIFLILNLTWLFLTKEKGIMTLFGVFKIVFISGQIYLLQTYFFKNANFLHNKVNNLKMFNINQTSHKYIIAIITFTLINLLIIYIKDKKKEKYLLNSFLLSQILVSSCFITILNTNPTLQFRTFLFSITFIIHSIILIASLYFSTWDKVFTDELTGLLNRRALDETLHKLGKTYSITMMDIDHFKNFNDTYGHQAGDDVLRHTANILGKNSFGKCYRYGGEEFAVITTGKTYETIEEKADNFRKSLEKTPFILKRAKKPTQIGKKACVTVSLGIASSTQFRTNPLEVIQSADMALYRAKKNGRNRLEIEKRAKKR
ncbi:MAG: GGDEF domain-containing protein [Candidatus Muirbacterium halophilum]|nr:GGDEF domain-containing protein [Candidatus Muirbacterium halophilum]